MSGFVERIAGLPTGDLARLKAILIEYEWEVSALAAKLAARPEDARKLEPELALLRRVLGRPE